MGKEIERKFVVLGQISKTQSKHITFIKQGYVLQGTNKHLRIRLIRTISGKTKAFICLKFTGKKIRDEFEYEIPYNDGIEIYDKCTDRLEKIRYHFICPENSNYKEFIMDCYPTELKIIEVEFNDIESCESFTQNLGWREVTGNKQFSNILMAKSNLVFNG